MFGGAPLVVALKGTRKQSATRGQARGLPLLPGMMQSLAGQSWKAVILRSRRRVGAKGPAPRGHPW